MIRLMGQRRRTAGFRLPVLLGTPLGGNAGASVNADATGFAILFDTDATSAAPSAISGAWTTAFTATNGSNISMRVSGKFVTAGEAIDPVGASRYVIRTYDFVHPTTPFGDALGAGGTGNNANIPALSLLIPSLIIGGIKRGGSGVPTWAAPIDQNVKSQNTTAVVTTAESAGLLASYAGQAVAVGVGNDWAAGALVLNGAPL